MPTTKEKQALKLLGSMNEDELRTVLNYMVGTISVRIEQAHLNVTYPPTADDRNFSDLAMLIRSVRSFAPDVQRMIEQLK